MGPAPADEDDDDSIHWITPRINVDSNYQSLTEKGIRRLCSQLLDMKAASDNELHCNMRSNYSAFVKISEEILKLEYEVIQLKRHISTQGDLVQELKVGVYLEALLNETCTAVYPEPGNLEAGSLASYSNSTEDPSLSELENHANNLCEVLDVLLAERKVDEALAILDAEDGALIKYQKEGDSSSSEFLLYQSVVSERKARLAKQFAEIAEQPVVHGSELRKALSGLLRLGDGPTALALFLHSYHSRLESDIQSFLPSITFYPETYATNLAQLVFSVISQAEKNFAAIFVDAPEYSAEFLDWAQKEIKRFVKLVKKYTSSSNPEVGFRAATMCVQASFSLCSLLEKEGLILSPYLLERIQLYWEWALKANLKQVEEDICAVAESDDWVLTLPVNDILMNHTSQIQNAAGFVGQIKLTNSAFKFISVVQDIVECLTPFTIVHFGGSILNGLACLFDSYINTCMGAIPCTSEDENSTEFRDNSNLICAETEAQQLALLGNASALADELIPLSISKVLGQQTENQEGTCKTAATEQLASLPVELKDWRRHFQRIADRLRDHFCRQYVLGLIYSREGTVQLTGTTYLNGKNEDLFWDADAMPSLSFQALFMKLNELAQLAAIVLVGRDKVVKQLLTRLTETVILWLSNDQDFWEVIEDDSASLSPFGLQQFILDMHFVSQIAKSGCYSSRHIIQSVVLSIITRAISAFTARGIDLNSALPEDDWFIDTAEAAIGKLRREGSYNNLEGKAASILDVEIDREHDGQLMSERLSDGEVHSQPDGELVQKTSKTGKPDTNPIKLFYKEPDQIPGSPSSSVSVDSFVSAKTEGDESP